MYIHKLSNHPPSIVKNIPKSISKRISSISCDEEAFKQAAPHYNNALRKSGFPDSIAYEKEKSPKKKNRRQRNIIWFNPPYNRATTTNIGRRFIKLLDRHFPKGSKLHKIFNRNTVKLSYSCMPSVATLIKSHNKRVANGRPNEDEANSNKCNCRTKANCPLDGNCQSTSMVYGATVKREDNQQTALYIGLTENTFKTRYNQHQHTFRHDKYRHSTELSNYVWNLKDKNTDYSIKWSIISKANAYTSKSKRCNLCLTEKLIIATSKGHILNKRSELISKCRHENKFYLSNFNGIT